MAEMTFPCPGCGQHIQCDQLWSGHQINCPVCQAQITVPHSPPAPTNPLVPHQPASSSPRLSAGHTQVARGSTGTGAPQRKFQNAPQKPSSPVVKYAVIGGVLVAVAAAVVVGLPYFQKWQEDRKQQAAAAGKPAPPPPQAGDAAAQAGETPPEGETQPAPPKQMPLAKVEWTLDSSEAKLPEGRANGSIAGTDFIPDLARLDKVGRAYVLSLRQGAAASPDRGILVYLHPPGGELPTNSTWNVSGKTRDPGISEVVRLSKTDPRFAAQQRRYYSGYTLKLELGKAGEDGVVPGKIFLALPDKEKSVVAGDFKASSGAAINANPAAEAAPAAPPPSRAMSDAYRKRYGVPGR